MFDHGSVLSKFGLGTRVRFAEHPREYFAMPDILFLCFGGMSCTEENSGADWKARSERLEWQLASPVTTHTSCTITRKSASEEGYALDGMPGLISESDGEVSRSGDENGKPEEDMSSKRVFELDL